jgi:hypothetical protein
MAYVSQVKTPAQYIRACLFGCAGLVLWQMNAEVRAQDFIYTTNNGTITVTGYTGSGGAVTIPSRITSLPVTDIGNFAFEFNTGLLSVTLPDSVTNIGDFAFEFCANLTGVTVGSSVLNVGFGAFEGCSSLTHFTIPGSVVSIGLVAFWGCTNLTAIDVEPVNTVFSSAGGVLFDKAQTKLLVYPAGKSGSYTIPNSVTVIGDYAFSTCSELIDIAIPNSVTNIGNNAFDGCSKLNSLSIPDSVISIGDYSTCNDCTSLTNASIGNSVTAIGISAFAGCTNLTNVIIGNSVRTIANSAFGQCTALPGVIIPNSVTNIGPTAFTDCISLRRVTIPNSVITIEDGFVAMSLAVAGAFSDCGSLTNVTLGNGISYIGLGAFWRCTNLDSITIPSSVTNIGDFAFSFCGKLVSVFFEGNVPSVGPNIFFGDNATVYYLPGSTGWGGTFGYLPVKLWNPRVQTSDGNFGVRQNKFGFNISGTADIPILVEASSSLAAQSWIPLQSFTLTNGLIYFSDAQWTNYPGRFYRIRSP